jgi:pSer/pThr/pTyr-binding forkhead associated (FHA) protein
MVDSTSSPHDPHARQASPSGEAHHEEVSSDTVAVPRPGGNTIDTTAHFGPEFESQLAALSGEVSSEELEAVGALPSRSALLIVRRGPNIGARFLLDSDVTTVGRHPDADIFLDDVTVSRKHSQFVRSGSSFEIRDLGSLNGTYFDGVRVDSAALTDGSEVQIGKFRLTFYASRLDLASRAGS